MYEYCTLCGKSKEDHSRYFYQPEVEAVNPKTKMPGKQTENVTIRIEVAANVSYFNHGSSEDFCEACEKKINNYLIEMEKMMWDIFQNKVWRSVDKVYETRYDCRTGRLEAA